MSRRTKRETTRDLATRWKKSPSCIRAWSTQREPPLPRKKVAGVWTYDPREADEWLRRNVAPRGQPEEVQRGGFESTVSASSPVESKPVADSPSPISTVAAKDADGRSEYRNLPTPNEARTLLDVRRRQKIEVEIRKELGQLVDADDARATWTRVATSAAKQLELLPRIVAPRLIAQEGLDPKRLQAITDLIEESVSDVISRLATIDLGGPERGD